ncbi:hypothetical protein Pcinc_016639 [Petrolisthes cinctipes]|uniref:Uncharacterized protein n=1 Tax=Petrolisthes cinctipes TaxID=88211 RepID=A0AAE1FS83_PETCI|nr:hypothetical protein Pcinc_016639 [Petrolisthes cinctipes]
MKGFIFLGDSGYALEPNLMIPVGQPANAADGRRRNIPLLDDPEGSDDPDDPDPSPAAAAAGARLAAGQARRRQIIQEYFS